MESEERNHNKTARKIFIWAREAYIWGTEAAEILEVCWDVQANSVAEAPSQITRGL